MQYNIRYLPLYKRNLILQEASVEASIPPLYHCYRLPAILRIANAGGQKTSQKYNDTTFSAPHILFYALVIQFPSWFCKVWYIFLNISCLFSH